MAGKSSVFDRFPDEQDELDVSTIATPDTYIPPSPSNSSKYGPSRSLLSSEQTGAILKKSRAKTTKPRDKTVDPLYKRFDDAASKMERMMELLQEAQEEKRRAVAERDRAKEQAEKAHYLTVEEAHRKDIAAKENLACF